MAAPGSEAAVSRTVLRRIVRILQVFAAIVVVLVVALLAALHSPPGRRFVLSEVTQLLAAEQIELTTDELQYNLFNLSVSLRNIRVRSAAAPTLPPFASLSNVRANLGLVPLLRGRYVVETGRAEGIEIHYFVDERGNDNVPRPIRKADEPEEPLDYLIADLTAADARIRYENRAKDIDVALPISELKIHGNPLTDRHAITVLGLPGTARIEQRLVHFDRVSGSVDLGNEDLRIERLDLEGEGSEISMNGTVGDFDGTPTADLHVRGRLDAAKVSVAARVDEKLSGRIDIDGTVQGDLTTPAIRARVRGSDVRMRDVDQVRLQADVAYDTRANRADLSGVDVRSPLGSVSGDGSVTLVGHDTSHVRGSVSALDVAAIMRAFQIPYTVATRVDARIQASWPGLDYLAASGAAEATLTPTRARAARSVLPAGGRLQVNANGRRIDAALRSLHVAGADMTGRVVVRDREQLAGDVQTRIADAGATLSTLEAFLGRPKGSLAPVRVAGPVEARSHVGGSVSSPAITAHVDAPALVVGHADNLAIAADIAYTPAVLTMRQVDATWAEAHARAVGRIGLSAGSRLDLTVDADALRLQQALRAAGQNDIRLDGTLMLHGRATGTLAQPVANATIQARDLIAYNETLGALDARLTASSADVTVSNVVLDKPQPDGNGQVIATGSYNIDRGAYTFDVRSDNVQLLSATLPDGRPLRGAVALTGTGAGTTRAPAGNITLAVDALRVAEYDLGTVRANAVLANQQAVIKATADRFTLNADATIGVQQPYPTTARLAVQNLDLAVLPLNLTTPLQGHLQATVDAAGDIGAPENGRATANVQALEGSWNDQPFSVDAPAVLRYETERLLIDTLTLRAQDATVRVKGDLPLTERGPAGALEVDARGNLATLTRYAPAGTELSGSGAILLTGTVRGTLKAIDPDLTVTADNASLTAPQLGPGLSNLQLRARVVNGEANIEQLDANWGPAEITATGRVPFEVLPQLPVDIPRKGGPATFRASVRELDPAVLPGAPADLSGRISLEAEIGASRAALDAVQGRITFPELQLAFSGLTLAQQQPSVIAISGGTAQIQSFNLSGTAGTIAARGTVGLEEPRPLDITADGNLDIGAVTLFTDRVRAEGQSNLKITARGTMASPELNGDIDIKDATMVSDDPNVAAEAIAAHVDLDGSRITLSRLTANVNGGTLNGSGVVTLGSAGVADIDVRAETKDFAFDAPLQLRSLSDAKLQVAKRGEDFVVSGQITVTEGGLTGDIKFDRGVLASMTEHRKLDFTERRNPFLERVRFNIDVDTAAPILIDNNLAKAEVTTDLRVVGTPYETGLAGQLSVLEGGEITLNERRYEVQRGLMTFVDERRIFPSFDLLLSTSASSYDITVAVTGTPGDTEAKLTSDPELPEPDILAMLVTGRTLEEMRGEEFEIAREQMLSYMTGRVGSRLGRSIQKATGLSEVRIEPNLIANETDPSARLTLGQQLTGDLKLVYSTNLTDSNDQIWVAEYDISRRFQTRAVRQQDNTYRLDFTHDVRFGGQPAPRRLARERPVVAAVEIAGDASSQQEVAKLFRMKAGDAFDFFRARRGQQRIENSYVEGGWLQSRVHLDREETEQGLKLRVRVAPGPKVTMRFEGAAPPRGVQDEVRTQWHRGVFDTQRGGDAAAVLRAWLMRDNYLQAKVTYAIEDVGAAERVVMFRLEPGTRFSKVVLAFDGASGIDPDELDRIIADQHLEQQLFTDPKVVTELLERYYREQGYLVADVREPRYEFTGATARVVLAVTEGPRFTVRQVAVAQNAALPSELLISELPLVTGEPFLPVAAENSLQKIRELYWQRGYNDVSSDYEVALDRAAGQVDVTFTIREGAQSVIAEIAVEGNDKTSEHLVRDQLELAQDQVLDLSALSRSRRNLYDTGAFSVVDVTREDLGGDVPVSTTAPPKPAEDAENSKPVRINVSVREVQPLQLRYGGSYDTERGAGGLFDISSHNVLGKARVVGLRSRYDRQLHEARLYLSQPALRYWPIKLTGTLFYREERNPLTEITNPFNVDRRGASLQGETELGDSYVWSYGFRYERARTFDPAPGGLLDRTLTVSPLTSTFTRDVRDEAFDASTGSFMSQAFAYSPGWLGSDVAFLKYFGQYFHYIPLQAPRRKPFTNEILRPRVVYATGIRIGLAHGAVGLIPESERFFAGGSTTLRGFAQNAVGPIGLDRLPLGGDAVLIINNELRFPLVSIIDGVVFSDIGNVYPRISDFSFTDLRKSAGVGLRFRTPWFLVRGDYGVVLDRRAGERHSRFYFSIGQAF